MKLALKRNSKAFYYPSHLNSHLPPTNHAFTIVELLVVIVVIGILAAITIISYTGISSKATVASIQSELSNAKKQLNLYYVDHGFYPTDINNNCPRDSVGTTDNKYCIKFNPITSYFYTTDNSLSPTSFCLTETNNSITYNITEKTSPALGDNTTYGSVLNLDAGNISSYSGSGTIWNDFSGLNNTGTLVNGVGYTSANGGSLTFDGVNDYVGVPYNSLNNLGNNFSMEAWINQSSITSGTIISTMDQVAVE